MNLNELNRPGKYFAANPDKQVRDRTQPDDDSQEPKTTLDRLGLHQVRLSKVEKINKRIEAFIEKWRQKAEDVILYDADYASTSAVPRHVSIWDIFKPMTIKAGVTSTVSEDAIWYDVTVRQVFQSVFISKEKALTFGRDTSNEDLVSFVDRHYDEFMGDAQRILTEFETVRARDRQKLYKDALEKGVAPRDYAKVLAMIDDYKAGRVKWIDENLYPIFRRMTVTPGTLPKYVYRGMKISKHDKYFDLYDPSKEDIVERPIDWINFTRPSSWSTNEEVAYDFMELDSSDGDTLYQIMLRYEVDPNMVIADFRNLPHTKFWHEMEILLSPDIEDDDTRFKTVKIYNPRYSDEYTTDRAIAQGQDKWKPSLNSKPYLDVLLGSLFSLHRSKLPAIFKEQMRADVKLTMGQIERKYDRVVVRGNNDFKNVALPLYVLCTDRAMLGSSFRTSKLDPKLQLEVLSPTKIKHESGAVIELVQSTPAKFVFNVDLNGIRGENVVGKRIQLRQSLENIARRNQTIEFKDASLTEASRPVQHFTKNKPPRELEKDPELDYQMQVMGRTSRANMKRYNERVEQFKSKWRPRGENVFLFPHFTHNNVRVGNLFSTMSADYLKAAIDARREDTKVETLMRGTRIYQQYFLHEGKDQFLHALQTALNTVREKDVPGRSNYPGGDKDIEDLRHFFDQYYDEYMKDVKLVLKAGFAIWRQPGAITKQALKLGINPDDYKQALALAKHYIGANIDDIPEGARKFLNKVTVDTADLPKYVYRGMFIKAHNMSEEQARLWKQNMAQGKPPPIRFNRASSWSVMPGAAAVFAGTHRSRDEPGFHVLLRYQIKDKTDVIADLRRLPTVHENPHWGEQELIMSDTIEGFDILAFTHNRDEFGDILADLKDHFWGKTTDSSLADMLYDYYFEIATKPNLSNNVKSLLHFMAKSTVDEVQDKMDFTFTHRHSNTNKFGPVMFPIMSLLNVLGGDHLKIFSPSKVSIRLYEEFESIIELKQSNINNFVFEMTYDDDEDDSISGQISIKGLKENIDQINNNLKNVSINLKARDPEQVTEANKTVQYYKDNPDKTVKTDAVAGTDVKVLDLLSPRILKDFEEGRKQFVEKWGPDKFPEVEIFKDDFLSRSQIGDIFIDTDNSGPVQRVGRSSVLRGTDEAGKTFERLVKNRYEALEHAIEVGNDDLFDFFREHGDEYFPEAQRLIHLGYVMWKNATQQIEKRALAKGIDPESYMTGLQFILVYRGGGTSDIPEDVWPVMQKMTVNPKELPDYVYRGIFLKGSYIRSNYNNAEGVMKDWAEGKEPPMKFDKVNSWTANKRTAVSFMQADGMSTSDLDQSLGFHVMLKMKLNPEDVVVDFRTLPEFRYWGEQEILLKPDAGPFIVDKIIRLNTKNKNKEFNEYMKSWRSEHTKNLNFEGRNMYNAITQNIMRLNKLPIQKKYISLFTQYVDSTIEEFERDFDVELWQSMYKNLKLALFNLIDNYFEISIKEIFAPDHVLTRFGEIKQITAQPNRFVFEVYLDTEHFNYDTYKQDTLDQLNDIMKKNKNIKFKVIG